MYVMVVRLPSNFHSATRLQDDKLCLGCFLPHIKVCEQSKEQRVKNTYFTVSNYSFTVEIDKKIITSSRSHDLQFKPRNTQNRR